MYSNSFFGCGVVSSIYKIKKKPISLLHCYFQGFGGLLNTRISYIIITVVIYSIFGLETLRSSWKVVVIIESLNNEMNQVHYTIRILIKELV